MTRSKTLRDSSSLDPALRSQYLKTAPKATASAAPVKCTLEALLVGTPANTLAEPTLGEAKAARRRQAAAVSRKADTLALEELVQLQASNAKAPETSAPTRMAELLTRIRRKSDW